MCKFLRRRSWICSVFSTLASQFAMERFAQQVVATQSPAIVKPTQVAVAAPSTAATLAPLAPPRAASPQPGGKNASLTISILDIGRLHCEGH